MVGSGDGVLGESGGLRLHLPRCEPGIGDVIADERSSELIAGVRVATRSLWPDDRGYFLEVARLGRGLTEEFPASAQVSAL